MHETSFLNKTYELGPSSCQLVFNKRLVCCCCSAYLAVRHSQGPYQVICKYKHLLMCQDLRLNTWLTWAACLTLPLVIQRKNPANPLEFSIWGLFLFLCPFCFQNLRHRLWHITDVQLISLRNYIDEKIFFSCYVCKYQKCAERISYSHFWNTRRLLHN